MTNTNDIKKRLKDACNGHPSAEIPWPHRLLHDAIEHIETMEQSQQAQGEPVAWAAFTADGNIRIWSEHKTKVHELAAAVNQELLPLYLHPAPAARQAGRGVAGWAYEYHEFGDIWARHVILNRVDGGANPPTKHHGSPVRNVTPLYTTTTPAPAALPEGKAIRLLARVQGWWQNTDGDMPASLEQDIANLLTASPAPGHAADVRKMVAPDVSELVKAAQTLWRESYSCESDFIQAVVDAFSKQEEEEPVVQQHYPCGCVTCICEDDVQCQGCGGTSCDDFKGPSCGCTHLKEEAER